MTTSKWPLLLTGFLGAALALGCETTKEDTGTGTDGGTGDQGATDGGAGDGGNNPGGGGTDGGTDGGGTDGGTDGGGGDGGGGGQELAAVAFYIEGLVDAGSTGDPTISGEMDALLGIRAYGVDGNYVNFDDYYCGWFAYNSILAAPTDCPDCEWAFAIDFDTTIEDGKDCDVMSEAMGPYGYTGPEVFITSLEVGFVKAGSGSYAGFAYDYGYVSFYLGYPYYYWYTTASYFAYTYDLEDYGYPGVDSFTAINGYYGVYFTP